MGGEVGVDRLVTEPPAAPWALGCSFLHQWREALGAQPTPAPGQTGQGGKWPGAISELRDQREKEAGQDSAGDRVPLQGGLGPCACLLPLPIGESGSAGWRGGPAGQRQCWGGVQHSVIHSASLLQPGVAETRTCPRT